MSTRLSHGFGVYTVLTDAYRLSIKELMRLFGPVREDEEGKPFILVDDKETFPMVGADSEDEDMADSP